MRWISIVFLLISVSACAPHLEYAAINTNFSVESVFRQGKVLPQYRYFYNGPKAMPDALLALDRRYTLSAKFWTEMDMTEDKIRS